MNMKRLSTLPLAALMLFALASCDIQINPGEFQLQTPVNEQTRITRDDAWTSYDNGITDDSNHQRYTIDELFALYSDTYLSTMSPSEKDNTQKGFSAFCKASVSDYSDLGDDELYWEIVKVKYTYGDKTLPGSLIWCSHGDEHKPINPRYFIIDSHWTMTGADEFPSKSASPVIALAHMDAVYVCPDQMADGEAQPYLCERITADRTVAMAKAVLGYLNEQGMKPLQICEGYSIGYSQGGASALAVQRAIEQDEAFQDAIGFTGTYSGAGPYSMTVTLEEWAKSADLKFPAAIGLIARAWDTFYSAPEWEKGYSANDYFLSAAFRSSGALDNIDARDANIGAINAKIRSHVTPSTVANLLNAGWDGDTYGFMAIAQDNDLINDPAWKPEHPIVFFHSTEDEVVPRRNTDEAAAAFAGHCPLKVIDQSGDHSSVGVLFYSWLGLQKGFPDEIHKLLK